MTCSELLKSELESFYLAMFEQTDSGLLHSQNFKKEYLHDNKIRKNKNHMFKK